MTQTHTKVDAIMQHRIDDAKNELRRMVQQMLSSGRHDAGAVKAALEGILGDWS